MTQPCCVPVLDLTPVDETVDGQPAAALGPLFPPVACGVYECRSCRYFLGNALERCSVCPHIRGLHHHWMDHDFVRETGIEVDPLGGFLPPRTLEAYREAEERQSWSLDSSLWERPSLENLDEHSPLEIALNVEPPTIAELAMLPPGKQKCRLGDCLLHLLRRWNGVASGSPPWE